MWTHSFKVSETKTIAVQTLNKGKVKVIDFILTEELKKLTKKMKRKNFELFPIVTRIFFSQEDQSEL